MQSKWVTPASYRPILLYGGRAAVGYTLASEGACAWRYEGIEGSFKDFTLFLWTLRAGAGSQGTCTCKCSCAEDLAVKFHLCLLPLQEVLAPWNWSMGRTRKCTSVFWTKLYMVGYWTVAYREGGGLWLVTILIQLGTHKINTKKTMLWDLRESCNLRSAQSSCTLCCIVNQWFHLRLLEAFQSWVLHHKNHILI